MCLASNKRFFYDIEEDFISKIYFEPNGHMVKYKANSSDHLTKNLIKKKGQQSILS